MNARHILILALLFLATYLLLWWLTDLVHRSEMLESEAVPALDFAAVVPNVPPTTTTTAAPTTTTHTHPPKPVARTAPIRAASVTPAVVDGSVWDRLAQCESGGNWSINTGNGYYGGLQFALSSWRGVGGTGYPHQHSREEQIHRAVLLKGSGPFSRHWPACSRRLGLG